MGALECIACIAAATVEAALLLRMEPAMTSWEAGRLFRMNRENVMSVLLSGEEMVLQRKRICCVALSEI